MLACQQVGRKLFVTSTSGELSRGQKGEEHAGREAAHEAQRRGCLGVQGRRRRRREVLEGDLRRAPERARRLRLKGF